MNSVIKLAPGIDKISEGSLYPHQSDGVAFLLSKKRVILADDMGLGKTRQAIVAMEAGTPDGKILVICTASLKLNWRREILMVDPSSSIEVLGLDKEPAVPADDVRELIPRELREACAAPGGVYIYTPTEFSSVKHLRFHAELYAMDAARPLQNELKFWKSVQFNSANDVAKEINLRLGW